MRKSLIVALLALMALAISASAQSGFSFKLDKIIAELNPEVYSVSLIPIDSVIDSDNKLQEKIERQLLSIEKNLSRKFHYKIFLGFYNVDSSGLSKCKSAYTEIKKCLGNVYKKNLLKYDLNCSGMMATPSIVYRNQNATGIKADNCIVFEIYKTNKRMEKLPSQVDCYF